MVYLINCKNSDQIYALIKPHTKSISDLIIFDLKKQPISDLFQMNLFNDQDMLVNNAVEKQIIEIINNKFDVNVFITCDEISSVLANIAKKQKIKILELINITDFNRGKVIGSLWDQNNLPKDSLVFSLFVSRMPNDYSIICQELQKLKNHLELWYDYNCLERLIYDYNNEQFFALIEYLLQKKYQSYLYELNRLFDLGYQCHYLLQIMSTQLFNLKLIKKSLLDKTNTKDACAALNISAFQYGKKSQLLYNIDISKINSLLDYFYELDLKSKKGKIDLLMSLKTLIERS